MFDEITLADSTIQALAGAALMPDLRTILLIDATYEQMLRAAQVLKQMLGSVTDGALEEIYLSATDTDDVLWGVPFLPRAEGQMRFVWKGKLTGGKGNGKHHLIVVPDLAQLSLAAERGFVMSGGADVVHLERHAQHDHWHPQNCWLAACAEHDIGKVSAHLLDRFALRIKAERPSIPNIEQRARQLSDSMCLDSGEHDQVLCVSITLIDQLRASAKIQPDFSDEAILRVLAYLPQTRLHSPRRDLALGRLSTAQAMLAGDLIVTAVDVDKAAAIIGLELPRASQTRQPESKRATPERPTREHAPSTPGEGPTRSLTEQPAFVASEGAPKLPVHRPDATSDLPEQPFRLDKTGPYPEDHARPEREANSLRMPMGRAPDSGRAHGPAVGVEKARALHDLALAATVFEAAKFWPIRRLTPGSEQEWLEVWPGDLRQYRRLPVPEALLVLVIDYTSLRKCAWDDALSPHLDWAYTSRAGIALIRVGAAGADHELRAERILGHSLLAPQIGATLEAEPGRATPLAHGLDLALQTLRHAMQHGRSAASKVRLVVLTDGRGNVPLAASRAGQIVLPVRREGIEDALHVAEAFYGLPHVEIVFLDPQPSQYAELPQTLANALGTNPLPIPRRLRTSASGVTSGEEVAR